MTKFERFREAIMEYSVIPLIIALVLGIANIASLAFFKTDVMWLIYLTTGVLVLSGVWLVVFLVCFIIDRISG